MIKLFLILLLLVQCVLAQPDIEWQKSFGGSLNDIPNSIQQTFDGGYIVAGFTESNDSDVSLNHGGRDYWLLKLNTTGVIEWEKSYGGLGEDIATGVHQTIDSGYIISGYSKSNDGDVSGHHGALDSIDIWIVKINNTGDIQWQKSFGGTGIDRAYDVRQTSDSGYVIAGYSNSINGDVAFHIGFQDYWVIKLDTGGTIQWQSNLGGTATDEANSIIETTDGGFLVSGYSNSSNGHVTNHHGQQDGWIVKLDDAGVKQWENSLGGTDDDNISTTVQCSDGGYIFAGSTESNDIDVSGNHGGKDCWIVKLDSSGTINWQTCLGGAGYDAASSIQQTPDGGFIIGATSTSTDGDVTGNHGDYDCWIVKINSTGTILWEKSLGGTSIDAGNSIQQTINGGFIIAAVSYSANGDITNNNGNADFWIVKLDSMENVGFTEIQKSNFDFQIFPNPVSKNLNYFSIKSDIDFESFDVRSVDGRLINNISSDNFSDTGSEILIDPSELNISEVKNRVYIINPVYKNKKLKGKIIIIE